MKVRITAVLATMALAFVAVLSVLPANAAPVPMKVAKLSPFTGRMTTNYNVVDGLTYYQWKYAENSNYCVFDDGAVIDLYTCSGELNDYWAAPFWGGTGAWNYDQYIKSEASGNCVDDPGEADNIRVELNSCAEVGGMSWVIANWGSYEEVTCGLGYFWNYDPSTPEENVTEPFTVKQGAWIVTAGYVPASTLPDDMRWLNLPS
jgi:hypothetical protein